RASLPWALHPGVFAALPALPRIVVDGFVVAPASFRVPPDVIEACRAGAGAEALARWRRAAALPSLLQAGDGDRLLPIDLDEPDRADASACDVIAGLDPADARAWEVWPPPDRLADVDGRR